MFSYSVTLLDPFAGKATRTYAVVAATFTAARVITDAFLLAIQNWTDLAVVEERLTEIDPIAAAAGANSNIDRGATMQFDLGAGKTASLNFPSPLVSTINPDRSVDLADPLVSAWTAPFIAGDLTLSDGDVAIGVIKGTLDK